MKTSFTQCPLFPLGDSGFMCVCNKPVQTEWQLCIGGVSRSREFSDHCEGSVHFHCSTENNS